MILEQHDLHNKNLNEATNTVQRCVKWVIEHDLLGCVFIHGKGKHSNGVPVLKQEIRRYLEESEELKRSNYVIVKGEDDYAITETLNDAHVVVIKAGHENDSRCGDKRQQEKAHVLFSEEGKAERKQLKKHNKRKSSCFRQARNQAASLDILRSPWADSELKKYKDGVAVFGKVSWLSDGCMHVYVIDTKIESVGLLSPVLVSQLSNKTQSLKLVNRSVPQYLRIHEDTSFYDKSDFNLFINDRILIFKYEDEDSVQTFFFD